MIKNQIASIRTFRSLATIAWAAIAMSCGAVGNAQAATLTWQVYVDTSSLSGTSGYLDFQFSAGNIPFDPGTATLSGFSTNGTLTGALADIGPVTGTLPGTVILSNAAPNDHTEGITFGTFFDLFVTLDVPTVSGEAAGGSTFSLGILDPDFGPLLLGSSPSGQALLQIDLDAQTGLPTVTNSSSGGEAGVTPTPEPSGMLLAFSCLAVLMSRGFKRALRA